MAQQLPQQQTSILPLSLLQTAWKAILDPLLANPSNNRSILKNVSLINGTTVINHGLGKKLTGWNIVRKRAQANIYDAQDGSIMPNLTLTLVSDATCVVDIEVF